MSTHAARGEPAVVAYLAFLGVILAFGIDASLPSFDQLRTEFGLADGSGEVSLVVTTYFLGMATGQMVWGLLADRFGRRVGVIAGLVLYGVGALGAAAAGGFAMLLVARTIWGLGAAAPAVLRTSIARDLYSGDQLARITSFAMAVFLIGPAIAPSVGEAVLLVGSWRLVFAAAVPLAVVGIVWAGWFGETLAPENARRLDARTSVEGIRVFLGSRAAAGFTVAVMLGHGGFFIYLGSGQPVIDEIYGLGDWFALIFAGTAAAIATAVLIASRLIRRHGAQPVASVAAVMTVIIGGIFLLVALATDGTPPFWFWYVSVTAFSAMTMVTIPAYSALAMTPMARVAGTAGGVFGLMTIGGGSLLAAVFDRQVDTTVTPMATGFVLYASGSLAMMRWARAGSLEIVEPAPAPRSGSPAGSTGQATTVDPQ